MSFVYEMHSRRRPNRSLRAEIYEVSHSSAWRTQSKRVPVHQISYDSYNSIVKLDMLDAGTDSPVSVSNLQRISTMWNVTFQQKRHQDIEKSDR